MSLDVPAGTASSLTPSEARVVKLPVLSWDRHAEAIVVLDESGTPRAYLNRCRHLPVPLDGGTRAFFDTTGKYLLCGTHGALYERGTGFCIEGPCRGTALRPIPLRITEDQLTLVVPE
ncbi:MAG: Rieske 2Fe-2S domain-containing protein [Sandaracinus sp.]